MLLDAHRGQTQHTHGTSCTCPACLGLQCLERPRYFSGQLLTEMDLNSEQAYMLAKQRLHNRYLHGTGIVCGLQVSCSPCVGTVTISSGYALDPCGNDIIVCDTQDFNVIQRIHDCEKEHKRQRKSNCDPIASPQDEHCQNLARHYCLTIAYQEQEARPSPILRQGNTNNGKQKSCGCNSSSSSQSMGSMTQTMSATSSVSQLSANCQPTRILEGYQFDVSEVPPDYCSNAKTVLEDTLLTKVLACFTSLRDFLHKKLPDSTYTVLTPLAFTGTVDASTSLDHLYRQYCYLRQTVHDLYTQDPLNTHCQTQDILARVSCEAPPALSNNEQANAQTRIVYVEQVRIALYHLLALLLQYMLDCVCQALLPPCAPSQTDDRLVLACMTVKNDQIVDICNFCHRHYAGSFPGINYWLSLVPVIPLLAYAVERLCCYDWLSLDFSQGQRDQLAGGFRGNLMNGLTSLLDSIDPGGSLRKEVFASNFAMPKSYAATFEQLINKVSSPAKIVELLHPQGFNLTQVIAKPVAEATAALQGAGVTPIVRPVATADEVPILQHLTTSPFAMSGDHIALYTVNDTVLGYAAHTPSPDIAQVKNEVASLKDSVAQAPQAADIGQLRSDVEGLKSGVASAVQPTGLDPLKQDIETLKSNVANTVQPTGLDPLKQDIEALKGNVANTVQPAALDPLKQDIEALKGNTANVAQAADLDAVRNEVETLKGNQANVAQAADVNQLRGEIDGLKGSMEKAAQSAALDAVKNEVEALKGNMVNTANVADVSGIRDEVSGLKNEFDTIRDNLAKVVQSVAAPQEVSDLHATIKALQDELAALKSEVSQLKSHNADSVDKKDSVDNIKNADSTDKTDNKGETDDAPPAEPAQ